MEAIVRTAAARRSRLGDCERAGVRPDRYLDTPDSIVSKRWVISPIFHSRLLERAQPG
jgi:hypothetical protein